MASIKPLRPPSSRVASSPSLSAFTSTSTSSSLHDQRPPSHQTTAGTPSTNPALRGASLAFRAPPPPPRPLVNTYSGRNGALAAATKAGGAGALKEKEKAVDGPRSQQQQEHHHHHHHHHNRTASNATTAMMLGPEPGREVGGRERGASMQRTVSDGFAAELVGRRQLTQSPSLLAATRAAAARPMAVRAMGAERKNGAVPDVDGPARRSREDLIHGQREQDPPPVMPDAASLVQLFEAKDRAVVSETRPPRRTPSASRLQTRDIAAPKPRRTVPLQVLEPATTDVPTKSAPRAGEWDAATEKISSPARSAPPSKQAASTTATAKRKIPPLLPPARKAKPLLKDPLVLVNQPITTERPVQLLLPVPATKDDLDGESDDSYSSARDMLSRTSTLESTARHPPPILPRAKVPDSHVSTARLIYPPPTTAHQPLPSPPFRRQLSPRPLSLSSNRPRSTSSRPPLLRPRLSASSLANALVASSLASSRAPSPSPSLTSFSSAAAAAASPRRRSLLYTTHAAPSPSFFLPTRTGSPIRSPSPAKPYLLPTLRPLRPPLSSTSTSTSTSGTTTTATTVITAGIPRHRPALLARKHPHKHHEGARRRWRDALTDTERRRYEGVWAANRGGALIAAMLALHVEREAAVNSAYGLQGVEAGAVAEAEAEAARREGVQAQAVAELWRRSGLADAVLAEVWGLVVGGRGGAGYGAGVAGAGTGAASNRMSRRWLGREEFVVGLWLVDQCLKGRKLPVRVGDSVWESVRGLRGVTVGRLGR